MLSVSGHVACITDLDKSLLVQELEERGIDWIDLDHHQRVAYHHPEVRRYRELWRAAIANTNSYHPDDARQLMGIAWKTAILESARQTGYGPNSLAIGYLTNPDHRSIELELSCSLQARWVLDYPPDQYAIAQVTYYLDHYRDKIIQGEFTLSLLDPRRLELRYQQLQKHHLQAGYLSIRYADLLLEVIQSSASVLPEITLLDDSLVTVILASPKRNQPSYHLVPSHKRARASSAHPDLRGGRPALALDRAITTISRSETTPESKSTVLLLDQLALPRKCTHLYLISKYRTSVIFGKPVIGYASRETAVAIQTQIGGILYRAEANLFRYRNGQWIAKTDRIPVEPDLVADQTTVSSILEPNPDWSISITAPSSHDQNKQPRGSSPLRWL